MAVSSSTGYAGDLTPRDAWSLLASEPRAQLIEVRTAAEWSFVGMPDLTSLNRNVHLIEWQSYPSMTVDSSFVQKTADALLGAGADQSTPALFICRSGSRSRATAQALTSAGFSRAYNVAGGFEGELDAERHRGRTNGWKASGLPWRQS